MRIVNIVIPPTTNISFFHVAQALRAWIDPFYKTVLDFFPRPSSFRIFIGDLGTVVSRLGWRKAIDVWWVDTALWYENLDITHVRGEVWVCSIYNAMMIKDADKLIGSKLRIVPRIAHPLYFREYPSIEKEYDLLTVATDYNRKNVALAERICRELKARCLIISPRHEVKPHSLKTWDLIKLYRKAKFLLFLSKSEGFGMPVLEANLLGVPAIFTDGHAVKEFGCGFAVPVKDVRIEKTPFGLAKMWYADEEKAIEIARKALELSKDEYKNLCEMCRETALTFQYSVIDFLNDYLAERLG